MNPQDMTPREIDNELARIARAEGSAEQRLASAIHSAHAAMNDRGQYVNRNSRAYRLTDDDALRMAREIADFSATDTYLYGPGRAAKAIRAYDDASADLATLRAEAAPLDAEYARRPWARYFSTKGTGAHTHTSMQCQTCNKLGRPTEFGWNPDLSGLSEAEAVAKLGPIMCTVCYPSAPIEWTRGADKPARCAGAGQAPVKGTRYRVGMRYYGKCTECGETQLLTSAMVTRAHKP